MSVVRSKLTLANRISIARLLGVPVFALCLYYYTLSVQQGVSNPYGRTAALLIFVALACTDALDGYIARSRGEVTRLGRILDPLADKALVLSALILLTRPFLPELQPQFPIVFTALVISRDALLVAGGLVIHHVAGHVDVKPSIPGKLSTALMAITICYALLGAPPGPFRVLVWITGSLVALSAFQYFIEGIRQLEKSAHLHQQK